jgi:hypothetical protein
MNLEKLEYLLSNPLESVGANCFVACLYVYDLVDNLNPVDDTEFLALLGQHFYKIKWSGLQRGDILCMTYNNSASCQHAFCYWDETQVFQKSGPESHQVFEICSIVHAVAAYSSKQLSCMWNPQLENLENVRVIKFLDANSGNCAYRRKSRNTCAVL